MTLQGGLEIGRGSSDGSSTAVAAAANVTGKVAASTIMIIMIILY